MEIKNRLITDSYNDCFIRHISKIESFPNAATETCDDTLCTATDIKVMLDDSRGFTPLMVTELSDTSFNSSSDEVSNNKELEPCVETCASHLTESKSSSMIKLEGAGNLTESESSPAGDPCNILSGARLRTLTKYNTTESPEKHCITNLSEDAPHDTELEAKEISVSKMEPCTESHPMELIVSGSCGVFVCNDYLGKAQDKLCMEPPAEDEVKGSSNDDIQSEVSDPNQSPKNIHSSMTATSQTLDVLVGDHGTSSCSLDTFVDCSLIEEEPTECKAETVPMDCVVLEIPKHVRPTGIRKITFKFNKRKNDYDKELSVPVEPLINDKLYGDFYEKQMAMSSAECLTSNDVDKLEFNDSEKSDMGLGLERREYHDVESSFSCVSNKELKMSKKIVPDDYPTNVEKLLSSGILEGARVKYISATGEEKIPGIIMDGGYLCGCSMCSYSRVVGAHEFELHAGIKTEHPNNHIYLENGKAIYSIIQELRAASPSSVDVVMKSSAGPSVNEEYLQVWKANRQNSTDLTSADRMRHCYAAPFHYPLVGPVNPRSYVEAPVERQRLIKKQRHYFCSSIYEPKKPTEGGNKKRDNDLHKLLFMPNGLPDGTSLAYCSKGKRILGGYKQGHGIFCSCCNKEISPSQFEAHAGWAAKRQPYRHIYTSSGLTLHDIALMLANGQSITSTGSDDMCAICGGGGELVICAGCPRAFHGACLGLQSLPADGWHCSHCRDKSSFGRKSSGESKPLLIRLKRVVKAPEFEPGGCIICRSQDFSAADFDDRTVIICDQCEKEYHVGCLRESGICDLKELPEDKWFCGEGCNKIFGTLQSMAYGGPKLIPASVSAKLDKKQAETCLSNGSKNEIQWCILSGKSRSPEHLLLLTRAAAIFRECFDPIVAKSGRDLIPVMVYGRNISGQEFSGMYCVVLIANSFVVSAALLRIFGQEVAELPLVATTRENQGKGYFQAIFSCIEMLLSSMGVKNLVLPAAEEAEPMWMNKLGFRKTNHEQMLKYTSVNQLTIFKGTSLLEKQVENIVD